MAAGTRRCVFDKERRARAGSSSSGLSPSPKELGTESLTVKGIISFLTLLAVSMWLLAHTGKLEEVMKKLVLLLMFLLSDVFCGGEGQKTAVQSYHFYGHPLLPQSAKLAICSCNVAPAFSCFAFLPSLHIRKYSGKASVLA